MQPLPAVSGTARADQPTGFLPEFTQFTASVRFYDKNGTEVTCGNPIFFVRNPVGTTVATVDRNTGMVTVQGGCGAALVSAWCNGITARPILVSSDCNGTSPPPLALASFEVSPKALNFVAELCGPNPPAQHFAILSLSPGTLHYTFQSGSSWLKVESQNGTHMHRVSVDAGGLSVGTYHSTITLVDQDAPVNRRVVGVTLNVRPPSSVANVNGTWHGSWLQHVGGFCDASYSLTWTLRQSGASVEGTYVTVAQDDCVDPPGTRQSARLVNGSICGNTLTIYTEGGRLFSGAVNGDTISGSSGGLFPGTFTIQK
jgi:hypothetical protein